MEGIGPVQRDIARVVTLLSAWVNSSVAQKAKPGRIDPVLLLIPKIKVLVSSAPGVQVLQASPPPSVALTNSKSFEGHEAGKVCAKTKLPQSNETRQITVGKIMRLIKETDKRNDVVFLKLVEAWCSVVSGVDLVKVRMIIMFRLRMLIHSSDTISSDSLGNSITVPLEINYQGNV